jgi:hypothetical protein
MAMVVLRNGGSPQPDALRAEIDLLRAAVAALRATRATAVEAARDEALAAMPRRLRAVMAVSLVSFAVGVVLTGLGAFAIHSLGLCP